MKEILKVLQEELQVNFNLFKWYQEYLLVQGEHFQHLLQVSLFYCCEMILDLCQEYFVAFGSESCSSCQKPASDSCAEDYHRTYYCYIAGDHCLHFIYFTFYKSFYLKGKIVSVYLLCCLNG
jgi:hypothetical protein